LDDIDAAVTGGGLRPPAIRLTRDGEIIPPAGWTRRARCGSVWVDDLVEPGRVLDLYAAGSTIVLQSLQRWWAPLTRFCRQLELELAHATQANAYLSPPGGSGFAPHHDTHDVFVLQVSGSKEWALRPSVIELPLDRHANRTVDAAAQPVIDEFTLHPGDCLYLPRGTVHSARAAATPSLHLTIGLNATTRHDIAALLIDHAADDLRFRQPAEFSDATDPAALGPVIQSVAAELQNWLATLDAPDYVVMAERLADRAIQRRRPLHHGRLAALSVTDDEPGAVLSVETPVGVRFGTAWRVRSFSTAECELVLADRRLRFPARIHDDLVSFLAEGSATISQRAVRLDSAGQLTLARRLLRESVLEVRDAS
jgi:hypothetical protein